MLKVTDRQYWMDNYLKRQLDSTCYNIRSDWDMVWIISGNGLTRTGKSMLAQQVCYYVAHMLGTPFGINNIVFSGDELRKEAGKAPKNSAFIYDESRNEADSKSVLSAISKSLNNFFAECGMYNHFIVLVLPDFFELNKSLAITRSSALIDCYRKGSIRKNEFGDEVVKFERGFFNFFGRDEKKKLYLHGKKELNYDAQHELFHGEFRECWIVDKDAYDAKKLEFLRRSNLEVNRWELRFAGAVKILSEFMSRPEIVKKINALDIKMSEFGIGVVLAKYFPKNKLFVSSSVTGM